MPESGQRLDTSPGGLGLKSRGSCLCRYGQQIAWLGMSRTNPLVAPDLLSYVYLSDGKMLNEEIVKAGYANLMTYPPNVKYQERFLKAYREAKDNRRGLWR